MIVKRRELFILLPAFLPGQGLPFGAQNAGLDTDLKSAGAGSLHAPLPALLSVNPVLRADFVKRRKDFEMAVQVFKNGRGFSAEFAVQI